MTTKTVSIPRLQSIAPLPPPLPGQRKILGVIMETPNLNCAIARASEKSIRPKFWYENLAPGVGIPHPIVADHPRPTYEQISNGYYARSGGLAHTKTTALEALIFGLLTCVAVVVGLICYMGLAHEFYKFWRGLL